MKKETKKVIITSIAKGVAHATVVPLIIMILVNHYFIGNNGGIFAILYLFVPYMVYKYSKNKDLSEKAFKVVLGFNLSVILVIILLVVS